MKFSLILLLALCLLTYLPLIGFAQKEASTQIVAIPLESIKPSQAVPTEPIEISIQRAEEIKGKPEGCKDLCGDGVCQEIVCLAIGCPCPETKESCPQDCGLPQAVPVQPTVALPPEVSVKISPAEEKPIKIEEREVIFPGIEKTPPISLELKPSIPADLPPQVTPQPTVTAKIEIDEERKMATIEVGGVVAVTKETLKFEEKSLKIETPKAEVTVNIMPNVATQVAVSNHPQEVKEVELKSIEERAIYEIDGEKQSKLLWILPVNVPIRTEIDATNGKVVKLEKPWWSFLAW